jgi:hypothetical protein
MWLLVGSRSITRSTCRARPAAGAAAVGLAYLDTGRWKVDIAGRKDPALASLRPLYDPEMRKIKA